MTFARDHPGADHRAFAERIKFGAVVLFSALWVTFVYFRSPTWCGIRTALIYGWGALDFAGGTVVHINAAYRGPRGLPAAGGPRIGYKKDNMSPHSMTLSMVGARCCGSAGSASTRAPTSKRMAARRLRS